MCSTIVFWTWLSPLLIVFFIARGNTHDCMLFDAFLKKFRGWVSKFTPVFWKYHGTFRGGGCFRELVTESNHDVWILSTAPPPPLSRTEMGTYLSAPIKRWAFKHHSNVIQTSFTRISGKSSIETSFKEFLNCFYHSYIIQLSFNRHSDLLPVKHHSKLIHMSFKNLYFTASIETSFRIKFILQSQIHLQC